MSPIWFRHRKQENLTCCFCKAKERWFLYWDRSSSPLTVRQKNTKFSTWRVNFEPVLNLFNCLSEKAERWTKNLDEVDLQKTMNSGEYFLGGIKTPCPCERENNQKFSNTPSKNQSWKNIAPKHLAIPKISRWWSCLTALPVK